MIQQHTKSDNLIPYLQLFDEVLCVFDGQMWWLDVHGLLSVKWISILYRYINLLMLKYLYTSVNISPSWFILQFKYTNLFCNKILSSFLLDHHFLLSPLRHSVCYNPGAQLLAVKVWSVANPWVHCTFTHCQWIYPDQGTLVTGHMSPLQDITHSNTYTHTPRPSLS